MLGQENLTKEDNSKGKQGRVMIPIHCTSSQCPISIYEVSTKFLVQFWSYALDKSVTEGRTDGDHYHIHLCLRQEDENLPKTTLLNKNVKR